MPETTSPFPAASFQLGSHMIEPESAPIFVAELGICHGGSPDLAMALAEAAIKAGAHCVKTETFQTETLVFDPSATCSYTVAGERITTSLAAHMRRYELPLETHRSICTLCCRRGVPFMCTVHDTASVDFMVESGASALKIASPDIVHFPLLRHVARTGLPIFLDTGSALAEEIERAVSVLREAGQQGIVVNHNPAGHPAPAAGHHFKMMSRIGKQLNVPVGLSDHFEGNAMLPLAVMMGAVVLEKPVTFDNTVPEPERNWALNIQELPHVLQQLRQAHASLGSEVRILNEHQQIYRDQNRVACAAARDLEAGEPLTLSAITFARPRRGIGVEHWDDIEGRSLRTSKKKYEFLQWSDIA